MPSLVSGFARLTNKAHVVGNRPLVKFNAPVAGVCARLEGWVAGVQVTPHNR
jgi:hypothetical protein